MKNRIANIRKDYVKNTLDEKQINQDPFQQFHLWLNEAIHNEIDEPTAMILSTVSEKGFPSSRTVLLKDSNEKGFIFFTNYGSRKGKHLQNNPNASLLLFWKGLERQIRIEGTVKKIDEHESDEYFYSRPVESQVNAIISPQSQKIPNRKFLEKAHKDFLESNQTIKRPDNWGGYILIPQYFEFWQGRSGRLHDRITYCFGTNNQWKIQRLAP